MSILKGETDVERGVRFEYIATAANACYELRNLHDASALLAALDSPKVKQLRNTISIVSLAVRKIVAQLREAFASKGQWFG